VCVFVCIYIYILSGREVPLFSVLPPPRIWRKDALFNTIKPSCTTIKTSLIISVATELSDDESDTEIAVTLPTEVSCPLKKMCFSSIVCDEPRTQSLSLSTARRALRVV